jgi:putative hemolysin
MMNGLVGELGLLLMLLVLNGVFSMAETALVSSRRSRLEVLLEEDISDNGPGAALKLKENPGLFFSTAQVMLTLITLIQGAASGDSLGRYLQPALERVPQLQAHAPAITSFVVFAVMTYLSVVIGELVPKKLAMKDPERVAAFFSPMMKRLATLAKPIVFLVDRSSDGIAGLLGAPKISNDGVSEEDVRAMIRQGKDEGVFDESEQRMVHNVLDLDDDEARDVMTPRPDVVWINLDESDEFNRKAIIKSGHSYFPVHDGDRDGVLGVISVKTLWASGLDPQQAVPWRDLMEKPLFVPEGMLCTKLVETFRKTKRHLAVVVNEFGVTVGLVSLKDIIDFIIEEVPDHQDSTPTIHQTEPGLWKVDGSAEIENVVKTVGISVPNEEVEAGEYRSLAGFLLHQMGHLPEAGENMDFEGYRYTIVKRDRQKIDEVEIRPMTAEELAKQAEREHR